MHFPEQANLESTDGSYEQSDLLGLNAPSGDIEHRDAAFILPTPAREIPVICCGFGDLGSLHSTAGCNSEFGAGIVGYLSEVTMHL